MYFIKNAIWKDVPVVVAILIVSRSSEYIIVIIISSQSHGDLSSADNLCKQFGPRSGSTERRSWPGPELFVSYTFFEKVNFEKLSADDKENMKNYPACKELNI